MAKRKILAFLFTALVIALLVFTGPVEGFTLGLTVNKEKPKQGETITFTANVNIEQKEYLPIDKLILELSGKDSIICTFDKNGLPLDSCKNVKVSKIQDPGFSYGYDYNFGYGYGFAPGMLKYKIEINTNGLKAGTYTPTLKVKINDRIYSFTGKTITLRDNNNKIICQPEWTCGAWSSCSAGYQFRECYRNINYCVAEEKPETERLCLADNGQNFQSNELIKLDTTSKNLPPISRPAFSFTDNGFADGLRFIIILLLMNCIITTINIIIKIQESRTLASRKPKRMPSIKKIN